MKGEKISIDIPAPGFRADKTISLMIPKTADAEVVDIGYPKWLKERVGPGEVKVLNKPAPGSHKGQNGKILIIGGSERYHGAVLLSAQIASRIVDLVYVSSVEFNNKLLEKLKPKMAEFIAMPRDEIEKFITEADVVLMGPGLGLGEETEKMVNNLLRKYPKKRFVLDADALSVVDEKNLHGNVVVTPHSAEFRALFGISPGKENTKKAAGRFGGAVLLKGETDYVSDGDEIKVNKVGNAGMTKGGTGDVLAGLVAGLAANNSIYLSAAAAAWWGSWWGSASRWRSSRRPSPRRSWCRWWRPGCSRCRARIPSRWARTSAPRSPR